MKIDRRKLIKGGLAVAGAAVISRPAESQAATAAYLPNRAPLLPDAFLRLPPGAVRPQGWIATQLDRQVNGLCGRYEEVSHFLKYDNTGWTRSDLGGWEEVTYWLRGYVDLGYVTGDSTVLSNASRWINGVISTQAPDGFFGPAGLRTALNGHADVWPHMPMLQALRSFAEYTNDSRVLSFLTRFFAYLNGQPTGVFRDGWGTWRWGDAIDVIYWLYNRTGDSFLLDLVHKIHGNSANWVDGLPNLHNVNISQGFREPAQYWMLSREARHRTASYERYNEVQSRFGQFPGGGFAGDENVRPGLVDPRQGFETCGIVEYMLSHELLNRITGDPVWADRTEELAFNMLPAALDPLGRSIHYITSANSVHLDNAPKRKAQFQNGFAMQSYRAGVDQYRCCPHNYGMGWPYFVEEMWVATPDGGLCAAMYGPCTVTAKVAGGTQQVTIHENTQYPFSDTIQLTFSLSSPATFPLQLRIPAWCSAPELKINGAAVAVSGGPRYVSTTRTWANGDTVTLRLPMRPSVRTWPTQHNTASVNYGPLTFSLRITENWVKTGGSTQWPEYDVHAGSAWNYGLVPGASISVTTGVGNVNDPFTVDNAPIRLTTGGQRIHAWQTDSERVVTPVQDGPIATNTPVEQITLIPMGAARLRITSFPQTGGSRQWTPGALYRLQNRHSGKMLAVHHGSLDDSANVEQFADVGSADHLWQLIDAGGGYVKVQNVNSGKMLAVENMSTANSARVQQYSDVGSPDHKWQLIDSGDGWMRLRNSNSGKVLGVSQMSTADSAQIVQFDDNGTADHDWRLIPDGEVKIQNVNSGKMLAVENMSTANSARVQQFSDINSADHKWVFLPDSNGNFRIRNVNSGKVLGVDAMSTSNSAQIVQFDDNGTADHLWRIRIDTSGTGLVRLQNVHSGKMLAVHDASTADSANVEQYDDTGALDHKWRLR